MRIKKISRDKVMVNLSSNDLEYFDINPADKIPQSGALHRLLYEVMEYVRDETGFDPYTGGQVIVEASATQGGMNLFIRKIRTRGRMTREEFGRVKSIKAKKHEEYEGVLSRNDILRLMEGLGLNLTVSRKTAKLGEIFFFDSFVDLEAALCHIPDDIVTDCSLYRNDTRYALITNLARGTRISNILSEFASSYAPAGVAADDIKEGWSMVAKGQTLVHMSEEIRKMQ